MAIDWNRLGKERELDKTRFYFILSGDKEYTSETLIPMVVNDMVTMVNGDEVLYRFADRLLRKRVSENFEIRIICGDNRGTDKLASMYANDRNYQLSEYHANWDVNGNKAGYERNSNMFTHVGIKPNNGGLIFWNGENPYTRNLIYLGWECGVPLRVYNYVTKNWMSQEEISDVQQEERRVQLSYGRGF